MTNKGKSKKKDLSKENSNLKEEIDSLKRESNLWMITSFFLGFLLIISIFTSGFEFQQTDVSQINRKLEDLKLNYESEDLVNQISTIQDQLKTLDIDENSKINSSN